MPSPYQFLPDLSLDEYESLKQDIRARGVQVPVEICADTNAILDGHHRVRIAKELGLSYPRILRAGLSEVDREQHALILNFRRRQLTRAQRREVVVALNRRGWSSRRIASATGISSPTVLRDLRSAGASDDATEETPTVVGSDGKTYPARRRTSVLVTTDHQQEMALEALQSLGGEAPGRHTDLRRLERLLRDQRARVARETVRDNPTVLPSGVEVRHSAIADLEVEPGTVSMVLTDPPYTLEAIREGAWRELGEFASRALRPGGLLVAMTGSLYLPDVMRDLAESTLEWWWMLTVPFANHPRQVRQRGLASAFRPVLVYRQPGEQQHPPWTLDVVKGGGRDKGTHDWGQSALEFESILKVWTRPGDLVVDPFLGGATTAIAALAVGGRRFLGSDVSEDWANTARARLHDLTQNTPMEQSVQTDS